MTSNYNKENNDPAGAEAPAGKANEKKPERISAKMKTQIVKRLLRGESLELLAREYGTTAAKISQWRDKFLASGEEAMKEKPQDEKDREISQLKKKLGDTTMDNELLQEKIRRLEKNNPLGRRRSKK